MRRLRCESNPNPNPNPNPDPNPNPNPNPNQHLLRELLPPSKELSNFRLGAHDMQRVLLRTSCLDLYLQSNLFIQ